MLHWWDAKAVTTPQTSVPLNKMSPRAHFWIREYNNETSPQQLRRCLYYVITFSNITGSKKILSLFTSLISMEVSWKRKRNIHRPVQFLPVYQKVYINIAWLQSATDFSPCKIYYPSLKLSTQPNKDLHLFHFPRQLSMT